MNKNQSISQQIVLGRVLDQGTACHAEHNKLLYTLLSLTKLVVYSGKNRKWCVIQLLGNVHRPSIIVAIGNLETTFTLYLLLITFSELFHLRICVYVRNGCNCPLVHVRRLGWVEWRMCLVSLEWWPLTVGFTCISRHTPEEACGL